MAEIFKLNTFGITQMNATMHAQFHQSVVNIIESHTVTALNLDATVFNAYKTALAKEQDMVKHSMADLNTPEVQEADADRDKCYRFLLNELRNLRYSNVEDNRKLYEQMQAVIFKQYPSSVAKMGMQEETSLLRGFINDLKKYFDEPLKTMSFYAQIALLETANKKFEAIYLNRLKVRSDWERGSFPAVRTEVDSRYKTVMSGVMYQANMSSEDEAQQAQFELCGSCIKNVNELIVDYKAKIALTSTLNAKLKSEADKNGDDGDSGAGAGTDGSTDGTGGNAGSGSGGNVGNDNAGVNDETGGSTGSNGGVDENGNPVAVI